MINCLIIDDEDHAIDILKKYVDKTPILHLVASTVNPVYGLEILNSEKIDLIFLDIQMPEISGLDFIKAIKGNYKVIITTAYSDYALEGFDLDVVDYLLKPIPFPRFLKAVQKAADRIISRETSEQLHLVNDSYVENDFILIKNEVRGKLLKINLNEIDYIEGMKNYVAFHHNGIRTLALLNMKNMEERLPKKNFIRVHKSYIIAIHKIKAIEGSLIILHNIKAEILLSETYKASFNDAMKLRLLGS